MDKIHTKLVYAKLGDLWSQIPLIAVLLVARYTFKKYCFASLWIWLKKPDKILAPQHAFGKDTFIKSLRRKELNITERQLERWRRLRRSQDKVSTLVKFCENMWTGSFCLYNHFFGLYVLWDKEWFWNLDHIYIGYPYQVITSDIWWYYMISSAFYWSMAIAQFWDVRRKDFWQMLVHHITTIALFSLSWVCYLHRVGTLVLLLHDSSGFLLDFGKAAKYAGVRGVTAMFTLFVVIWIITRLILFPFFILKRTTTITLATGDPWFYALNLILCLLLLMDIFWTKMLFKSIYNSVTSCKIPSDTRSSSSDSEEEVNGIKLKT